VLAVHERGLCHRDVKGENAIVERSTGRVLLIDFGLSRRCVSAVTLGVGTPDYMAPELVSSGDLSVLRHRTTGRWVYFCEVGQPRTVPLGTCMAALIALAFCSCSICACAPAALLAAVSCPPAPVRNPTHTVPTDNYSPLLPSLAPAMIPPRSTAGAWVCFCTS